MSEDSDGEDSASLDVTDEDLARVEKLQRAVEKHPSDYAAHADVRMFVLWLLFFAASSLTHLVQLVATLRRCRLRSRLHDARMAMASRFPLGEQAWREWLEDEVQAAGR